MPDLSLYNVVQYSASNTYEKNGIVLYNSIYYYSLVDNNRNNTPYATSPYWGGYKTYGTLTKTDFFWKASYNNSDLKLKPTVNVIKFGDGYEQRVAAGINSNSLKFSLTFEGRDKNETRAIAHFLHKRKSTEGFFFDPPFPYNFDSSQTYPKRFVCEEWTLNYNFFNNYTVSTTFVETANL